MLFEVIGSSSNYLCLCAVLVVALVCVCGCMCVHERVCLLPVLFVDGGFTTATLK